MKTILSILITLIAVTAILPGLILIYNPNGEILHLSLRLLVGTPFKNFMIPGIILTMFVGGINLLALWYAVQGHPNRYNWAMAAGFMIIGWIIAQMVFIQSIHWLHFIYLGIGLLIILIGYQLKGKWAV